MTSPTGSADGDLVLQTSPDVSVEQAAEVARETFGVTGEITRLGSNQDHNFLIEGPRGRLLLKIANPGTSAAALEIQSSAAAHLADRAPGIRAPRSVALSGDRTVAAIDIGGRRLHARMLDFLDGSPVSAVGYLSPAAIRSMGELAARVSTAFADADLPGAARPDQWDLRQAPKVLDELLPSMPEAETRERLRDAAEVAWRTIDSLALELPTQLIHGDLTDDNVIWSDPITHLADGVIDFGDLNVSWSVAELAILVTSLMHHPQITIGSVLRAVTAFHAIRPLSRAEAEALWPMVVLRATVLVASGHYVVAHDPGNAYASENFDREQRIFEQVTALPLDIATALVLGASAHPQPVLGLPEGFGRLLPGLAAAEVGVLDLSATSPALHEGRWLRPDAEALAAAEGLRGDARVVVTRFLEPRLTRSRPLSSEEPANVVLGLELTVAEPLDVLASWDGRLEVGPEDGAVRLVGSGLELWLEGLDDAPSTGGEVRAGERLGRVGTKLSVRVQRPGVDVPETVAASQARAWRAVVADPTPLLYDVPETTATPGSPAPERLIDRRQRVFADAQEFYYEDPPVMVRGWREYLVDEDARVYLDSVNNVTSIGHAHPHLVHAVTEQWRSLNTNSRFNCPAVVDFSERLCDLLPPGLDTVFLVNSGSEAVDLALRIARAWTGRQDVLTMHEAYHGWTDLSDAVSTSIADNPSALTTRPAWVHPVEAPNSYRGRYRGAQASAYADEAVAEVERLARAGTPVGALIAETYYGNAGGIALPDGYLEAVYAAVRAHGGLAIGDEIQVGYGRLGRWLWGFEQQGVVPDVVTIAKAVGNGQPIGAVITSREIAEGFRDQGGYFFSSAGGNPVSCVAGLAVLDVIRDERLQENAATTGDYFKARLAALGERHPMVGAVHGSGLYLGLEFVRDRETLEPAPEETAAICERLRERGVIVQPTSDRQCVLKIKPPLCLTRESADAFVAALDEVLSTGW